MWGFPVIFPLNQSIEFQKPPKNGGILICYHPPISAMEYLPTAWWNHVNSGINMGLSENVGYIPNEIAI